jgi:FtsP/CotA-like multicopper oxidase with cupredoxin domain
MFIVHLGDVVQIRIVNDTTLSHPMRLHGHHALAVSRNGAPSTGAPWWIGSPCGDLVRLAPAERARMLVRPIGFERERHFGASTASVDLGTRRR